jgi:calcineurin-like phosphoesterase family protein
MPDVSWTRRSFCSLALAAPSLAIAADSAVTFGVIADPQYCDCERKGSRYYRASPEKLGACVEALNSMDLEFVINLGDFIDKDFASFDRLIPIWKGLKHQSYQVLGNHDYDVADDKKALVPKRLSMPSTHYDFALPGWRFLVLDGNEMSLHPYVKGSTEHSSAAALLADLKARKVRQAQPWNGALGETQRDWLANRLEAAQAAEERVIVFCHYPSFPADPHNLWDAEAVTELLGKAGNVAAYMNGHNHKGNYGVDAGVHYVNFKGMVERETDTAFATVSCFADRLEITGYGLEFSRELAL